MYSECFLSYLLSVPICNGSLPLSPSMINMLRDILTLISMASVQLVTINNNDIQTFYKEMLKDTKVFFTESIPDNPTMNMTVSILVSYINCKYFSYAILFIIFVFRK